MNIEERLAQIEAAAAQPGGLILRSVMRATEGQPDLLRALEAAAVPHWWDVSTLAVVLGPDLAPEAPVWKERLCALSYAEPFLAVPGAFNIHEVARLALRGKLHTEGRLPEFSARALQALDQPPGETATDRTIERLYHQLLAEPEAGAEALESAWREWDDQGRWATLLDLAAMLEEVLPHLTGPARARALLRRANIRRERCLLSKIADEAAESLQLFQQLGDEWAQSQALNFLGNVAVDQGKLTEAQDRFTESLRIAERLAASEPGNVEWQREFSVSLNNLGDLAVEQGNLPEAERRFAEALRIDEQLAALDPSNSTRQFDLGISHECLGDVSAARGDLDQAKIHYANSFNNIQRLAASDVGNAAWQRDLSVSLSKLGDIAVSQEFLSEAKRHFAEALRITKRLAESDPGNAEWQRDLSMSLSNLGDLAVEQGNLSEAKRHFAEALRIAERLAESDPGNTTWQHDLSVSLSNLGDLAVEQGNLLEAELRFVEALRIAERLAASDPGNAVWQRDLSVSLNKLGDVAVEQGNLSEAKRYFADDLTIAERLAASDPGNAEWQHDLSVSLNNLGDLAIDQGNLSEAERLFAEALKIAERLAASDPGDHAEWKRDLWNLHWRLADLHEKQAQEHWQSAHAILTGIVDRGLHLSPQDKAILNRLQAKLHRPHS